MQDKRTVRGDERLQQSMPKRETSKSDAALTRSSRVCIHTKKHHRDGRACFFVCMHFNITVVLCFAPSLFLRNCRMVRALATSSLSDLWVWSHGPERLSPRLEWPVTSSVMTPFQPSRLSKWKWGLIIIEGRGLSARLPPCTQQRKVQQRCFLNEL